MCTKKFRAQQGKLSRSAAGYGVRSKQKKKKIKGHSRVSGNRKGRYAHSRVSAKKKIRAPQSKW